MVPHHHAYQRPCSTTWLIWSVFVQLTAQHLNAQSSSSVAILARLLASFFARVFDVIRSITPLAFLAVFSSARRPSTVSLRFRVACDLIAMVIRRLEAQGLATVSNRLDGLHESGYSRNDILVLDYWQLFSRQPGVDALEELLIARFTLANVSGSHGVILGNLHTCRSAPSGVSSVLRWSRDCP